MKSRTFPPVEYADRDGFLAAGGSFSPDILWDAYQHGIFPWPHEQADAIWWFAPPVRFVLYPEDLHLSRSLQRTLRKKPFTIRTDTAFTEVMENCMNALRPVSEGMAHSEKIRGTWILPPMVESYTMLHRMGIAHSIEAWHNGELVGGLYGLCVGSIFCGESMFTKVSDAAKCAFATFALAASPLGIRLIDCQARTNNMARYGAKDIPRKLFMEHIQQWKNERVNWHQIQEHLEDMNKTEDMNAYTPNASPISPLSNP